MKTLYSCKNLKYGLFSFIFLSFVNPVYAGNDNLNELREELAETSLGIPTTHPPLPGEQPTSPVEEVDNDDSNINTPPILQLATIHESQPTTIETEGALTVISRRRASLAYQRTIQESIASFQRTLRNPHFLPEFLNTRLGRLIYQEVGRYIISEAMCSAGLSSRFPSLPWRAVSSQPLSETSNQEEDLGTLVQHPRSLLIPFLNLPFLPSFNFIIQEPEENRRFLSRNEDGSFSEVNGEERDDTFFSFQKMAFNFAYKTSELYEQYSILLNFTFFLCYFIKILHN